MSKKLKARLRDPCCNLQCGITQPILQLFWHICIQISEANPRLAQEQWKMLRPGWTLQQTVWMPRSINWTRPLHVVDRALKTSHSRIGRINIGRCKSIHFFSLISAHPTCRFYGKNYPRLLKIKKYWDPENIINHCYSVGSTDQECCVQDNWRTL